MDFLFNLQTFITAIISAAVTWGSTFLFYRQEKKSRDIDNEARQSEEWRKLYLESQEDSRKKDKKIDDLYRIIEVLRSDITKLDRRVQLNAIYRCTRIGCTDREGNKDINTLLSANVSIPKDETEEPDQEQNM